MLYDIENGIRRGDKDAVSFNYDARPLVPGEAGAGSHRMAEREVCVCGDDMSEFCIAGEPCISL